MTQQFLPGFEFMSKDDEKRAKDKKLQLQQQKLEREYEALKDCYSSPFKLINHENQLKAIKKAREDLWKDITKC